MKKIFLLVILACLMFWSCDLDDIYNITVTNHSVLESITATFNNANEAVVLAPGESKIVELWSLSGEVDDEPRVTYSPEREVRVSYQKSKGTCDFYDRERYNIEILNYTGHGGILTAAENWMDNIDFTASPSPQSNIDWVIYTTKPDFSATLEGGFPVGKPLFILDNNTLKVTIGNPSP